MRELINYYYLKRLGPAEQGSQAGEHSVVSSTLQEFLGHYVPAGVAMCLVLACCALAAMVRLVKSIGWLLGSVLRATIGTVAKVVLTVATTIALVISKVSRACLGTQDPFWPFVRFLLVAMLHGRVIRFFEFVVLMARWRVIICLANCNELCSKIFFPFVFVAQKFLKWNASSWLLGCACDAGETEKLSVLSWMPVQAAEALVWLLKLVECIPFLSFVTEPFVAMVEYARPMIAILFDLLFSIGLAEGLAKLLTLADGQLQPKLVLLSLNVSRMIREGPQVVEHAAFAGTSQDSAAVVDIARQTPDASVQLPQASSNDGLGAAPEWKDDGAWNLFDQ